MKKTSIKTMIQRERKIKEEKKKARQTKVLMKIQELAPNEVFKIFKIEFYEYFNDLTISECLKLLHHLKQDLIERFSIYDDFSVNEAKEGIIRFFEAFLNKLNPSKSIIDLISKDYNAMKSALNWAKYQARAIV